MSSPVLTLLHHLGMLGFHTDGSLFAFTRCLPETDVVQELVDVVIEALFTFTGAPDLYALWGQLSR